MGTIDLGPPLPSPHDLLDGLPRRVALTLPELRFVAAHAGGAPLPFEPHDPAPDDGSELADRLGGNRASLDHAAYAEALAGLHDPAESLTRRGLMVGGPDDGVVDQGIIGAVGLLATPVVAVDLDVTAGGVQAKSWHRQSGGAVAALSTHDGVVFELAWFPTWAWAAELARVAVVPVDLGLHDSAVPGHVDLPHALVDAALEAARTHRHDLVPVLVAQHAAHLDLAEAEVTSVLGALASEARGRLRALVAQVDDDEVTTVGVLAWTLVADGWRALRPHETDGRLHVELARVIPDDLGAELAPVLAEATR